MKIYFYEKWRDTAGDYFSPIKSVGRAIIKLDIANHTFQFIVNKVARCIVNNPTKSGKEYFVRLKDRNYINEMIGNTKDLLIWIKDCLSDENIIKEKTGRGKIWIKPSKN
jgi:hypothetical protein